MFLFTLFLCSLFFTVRGEVSIKTPPSKLDYLYFFSDILVVSYVLLCVPCTCPSVSAFAP